MSAAAGTVRRATHAGSWYDKKGTTLASQLSGWLADAQVSTSAPVHAIIAPHAGYSYSGPTAAFAYKHVLPNNIRRVFILGPSHHHSTRICELTALDTYATPLSPLIIDRAVVTALRSSKHFSDMSTEVDEDEHSIEMHLPYVAHVMSGHNFTIVPILVGALSSTMERNIADALKPYWSDSTNLFVISSDFCHWGQRFRYQPYDRKFASISESIRALDHRGMALIEAVDVNGFIAYQQETSNTICGRHPIGVLLALLDADKSNNEWIVKFVRYAQSSACTKMSDSSVSYASAIIYKKTDAD